MTAHILLAPTLLFIAHIAMAQDITADTDRARSAVHGSCQVAVKVQAGSANSATCDLTIGDSEIGVVPRKSQLSIEHVSAHCVGLQIGEIAYLALYTKMRPNAQPHPSFIPLARRPFHERAVQTRYIAAAPVVLYAGPDTTVTAKLALEPDIALPLGAITSCDVQFQGHLAGTDR